MRVAFNARLLAAPILRGWNRYTINLLSELPALGVELFLYSDQPLHPSHLVRLPKDSYQIHIAPPMRYILWEQYWLPKQCKKDRVDILHCPMNFGLPWSSPCPTVLTLHDAIDQVYYSRGRSWQQYLSIANLQSKIYYRASRHRASHIITDSHYSKNDIIKYLRIPKNKITTIYLAADARFHKSVSTSEGLRVRSKYMLKHRYFFYVGGWEKRKNIPFLIRAFAQANLNEVELVLAGGRDEQRAELLKLAEALNISEHLRLLGWVDDTDLPALYAEALCFVYPSEYEGFGLQLCEAMAVGCPVLAARATCLPEVLGEGGKMFGLDTLNELKELLVQLVTDNTFQNNLRNRALQMSKFYSWTKTATITQALYSYLLKA